MYTHLRTIGDDKVSGINGVNECTSQVDCTPARVSHLLLCPVSVSVHVRVCACGEVRGRTRNNMWVGLKIITVTSYLYLNVQLQSYSVQGTYISLSLIKQTGPSIIDTRLYPTNPAGDIVSCYFLGISFPGLQNHESRVSLVLQPGLQLYL